MRRLKIHPLSVVLFFLPIYVVELDVNSVPENTGFCFFLYALIQTAHLTSNDFMWLKGTLSVRMNLKNPRILEFLKMEVYPPIDYELNGFILRIPLVSIQNWYQKQNQFSNPEVRDVLSHFRCEFGLNSGRSHDVFRLIRELEVIGHREIRDLTIPCNRTPLEFEEMERYMNESVSLPTISEFDVSQLNAKLKAIDMSFVC